MYTNTSNTTDVLATDVVVATFTTAIALASDREHLLAVIEAGFGDFHDFNRVARSLSASRISRVGSSRSFVLAS